MDRADGRGEHLTSLDSSLHDAGPTGHALASGQEVIRSRRCGDLPGVILFLANLLSGSPRDQAMPPAFTPVSGS